MQGDTLNRTFLTQSRSPNEHPVEFSADAIHHYAQKTVTNIYPIETISRRAYFQDVIHNISATPNEGANAVFCAHRRSHGEKSVSVPPMVSTDHSYSRRSKAVCSRTRISPLTLWVSIEDWNNPESQLLLTEAKESVGKNAEIASVIRDRHARN